MRDNAQPGGRPPLVVIIRSWPGRSQEFATVGTKEEVPQRGPGQSPGGGLGAKPTEARHKC